jgi:hypothetical protein
LDWTSNPLVAAFFSSASEPTEFPEDAGEIIAARVTTNDVIDPERTPDPMDLAEVGFIVPRSLTPRIINQSGLFSVHPRPTEPWTVPHRGSSQRFRVPSGFKSFLMRRLFQLGVDAQFIYGGLEGLGQRLRWQATNNVGIGAV